MVVLEIRENNLPNLLSPQQIKSYLGCSNKKVYDLMSSRTFPSLRIGKRYYVIESDFIDWIGKQTKKDKSYAGS
ncbi:MAG: helix-turn-helix domain-containing protein [Oscillospiraceae bacterium]|nr:helix-turn-helix domain-containing protein [Oscillospiraceae bacterium]